MVRLQNITEGSLRVTIAILFIVSILGVQAQNTPPPKPAICINPPNPLHLVGGDFDVIGPLGPLTSTICLEPFQDDIKLDFVGANDPSIGPFNIARYYIQNVVDTTDFNNDYQNTTSFTYEEGYYWTAQTGISNAGDTYHNCKLIQVVKRQPVTASVVTCGTSTVTVTIPSVSDVPTNNHSKYIIEWGSGEPTEELVATGNTLIATRNFNPTSPVIIQGEYTTADGTSSCSATQAAITLPDAANIVFISKLEKKENLTDYEISFEGFVQNTTYKISYAVDDGNYLWVEDTGDHVNGFAQITGLDPAQDYCFKIAYVDNCTVSRESNTVCSVSLSANIISDTDVDLAWNAPLSPTGVLQQNSLEKDELTCPGPLTCFNQLTLSSPLARNHTFTGLKCSSVFTFQVLNIFAVDVGNGTTKNIEIISNTVNVDPVSTGKPPKPIFPAVVSYTANINVDEVRFNITLENPANDKSKYNFYRSIGGSSNYTLIGDDTNNTFIDSNVDPNNEYYCYKYTYFDVCGNESEQSDAYCTIFLDSKAPQQLDWTQYLIPGVQTTSQVIYTIELIDENGRITAVADTQDLSLLVAAEIANTNAAKVSFRIVATQVATLPSGSLFPFTSRSNVYTFDLPAATFIPTAFTPNNDRINDIFKPELRFVASGTMIIYDRWGSIVYESDDLKSSGWNGTEADGNNLAPVGLYTYKIQALSVNGTPTFYSGTVTLIR